MAAAHHIGRPNRSRVDYEERDYLAAANALRSRGFEVAAPAPGGRRGAAGPGGSEKAGAAPVMESLLAVVPLHMDVQLPAGGRFIAADWRELDANSFDVMLVCENLEPLTELHSFGWLERDFIRRRRTLAVFRGMPGSFPTGAAASFVAAVAKPVLGFYDFDPAGLAMAAAGPRLEALCLPPWQQLEASTRHYQRTHLYLDQAAGCRAVLDTITEGPVREAWARLKVLQCGLNQENFPR
ncbi:DUF7281 domain-containing protein [Ramlibacter sp. AN1133]|uniref:DUF7281 domain-containing protein n=1 Tax=Ramlibacter sp. AN1133 TaxID=3133429 RepID=UPI0030BCB8EA